MAARKTTLSAAELARLGADRLAAILVERVAGDPVLDRRLRMLVAAADPRRLAEDIGRRIQQMARARSEMDFEQAKAAAREVADLHRAIVDDLAPARPGDAVDALWKLVDLAPALLGRAESGADRLDAATAAVIADLGRLSASLPDVDPAFLARRIATALDGHLTPAMDGLLAAMADALGPHGRALLRDDTMAELLRLPSDDADWRTRGVRFHLVSRLRDLADLDRDVDAFAAAAVASGMPAIHSVDVARRLLAAGRAAEGLEWVERHPPRADPDAAADLRIALLEALGRHEDAQTLRRTCFEHTLSARHLRDYLKKLPDFEGFAAEQRALDHAAAWRDTTRALEFLIGWPDLVRADQLATQRLPTLQLTDLPTMLRVAEALDPRHPATSVQLRRRAAALVLGSGASSSYADAALALVDAGRMAARLKGEIEPHADFVAGLRREHGRKWRFWQLHDEAG